jgi:DNA-directed RNA polymerase alpha subunit
MKRLIIEANEGKIDVRSEGDGGNLSPLEMMGFLRYAEKTIFVGLHKQQETLSRLEKEKAEEEKRAALPQPKDELSIDVLELPERAHNALWRKGHRTVGAVKKLTIEKLTKLGGIGKLTLSLMIEKLAKQNIILKEK